MRTMRDAERARLVCVMALAIVACACVQPAECAEGVPVCVAELEEGSPVPLPDGVELLSPASIAVDHRQDLIIADSGNHRILVATPEGELVVEYGGFGWDEGQFDLPRDLSVYRGFFTYVLDEGNRRVERFDVDGEYVDRVVAEGEAGSPVAIAVGRSGELLVVDEDSQSVLVRSQFDEPLELLAGRGAGQGRLLRPAAIAVGPGGEIAVADPGRSAVLVYDEFGTPLYELTMADTLSPVDVLFDAGGALLVADSMHARIVAFRPGGGRESASLVLDDFVPTALALYDEDTLVVLDGDRGSLRFVRMTHADCALGL